MMAIAYNDFAKHVGKVGMTDIREISEAEYSVCEYANFTQFIK